MRPRTSTTGTPGAAAALPAATATIGRTGPTLVFWGAASALGMLLLSAERAVLLAVYADGAGGATAQERLDAHLAGVRFDAAGLAFPMAAALLVSTLLRLLVRRGAERACAMTVLVLTTLVAVVEVPWFGDFRSRLDVGALEHLDDPATTGRLVVEAAGRSGVLLALVSFAVPVALAAWAMLVVRRRTLDRCGSGWPAPVAVVVLLATFLAAGRAGITRPLGLADVDAAPRTFLGQIASSGLFTLGRQAWQSAQDDASPDAYGIDDATARDAARRVFVRPGDRPMSDESPSLRWSDGADPAPLAGWNVVLVLCRSLAARHVGCLGATGAEAMTPAFDRLAANGVLFTRFLANGPSASGAVPAVFAGFPGVARRVALTQSAEGRQSFLALPHLLVERGWSTAFVSGGAPSFENLGGWLRSQGFERTIGRADFPTEEWPGVWGPDDRRLFERTLTLGDEMAPRGPFLVSVLTSSNGPPFPLPVDAAPAPGDAADPVRERAMRYADRELGRFLDAAQSRPWGRRTLFVVLGDHGFRAAPRTDIEPDGRHVPLLLLTADGRLPPRRDDRLASQVDLLPTVMQLVHTGPFVHAAWGRDLFAPDQAAERYAVLGPDGGAPAYAVVTDAGEFLVDRLDDTPASLFHLDFATHALTPIEGSRAEIERLRRLGRGYLRAADRTLFLRKAGG